MASNKLEKFGPTVISGAAANFVVLAAAGASATGYTATATYGIIRHIHVVNITGTAATLTMFLSLTSATETAGKEFIVAQSIAANSSWDWYGMLRMTSLDFLTVKSGTASALTIIAEGEIGLA